MGIGLRRLVLVVALLPVPAMIAAGSVAAHDDLVSASPGQGDTLRVVPHALRLVFTRAQNLDLASVILVGPRGEADLGELSAHPDSAAVVLVPVRGAWSPGAWTVRWRIVGQDGHPVSGEYGFVVAADARGLPAPEPGAGDSASAAPPGRAGSGEGGPAVGDSSFGVSSPAYVAIRWIGFAALLGVLGVASWGLLVLPLAARKDGSIDVSGWRRIAAGVGVWAAGVMVVAALARLWAQAAALGSVDRGILGAMLGDTVWGVGWIAQVVAGLVALGVLLWARRGSGTLPWALAGVCAVVLAFTPALSGHAVGVEDRTALAVLADGAHVVGAGGWMGGLLVLLAAALPAVLRGEGPGGSLSPLVEAFSATALGFATLLVLSGVASGWIHLGSIGALWGSAWGRTLGLKLVLLLPLLALGAYNWLRVRPALARGDGGARILRRSGTAELGVAVLVLLVTAVLVGTPPPAHAGGAQVATSTISSTSPEGP